MIESIMKHGIFALLIVGTAWAQTKVYFTRGDTLTAIKVRERGEART
jgi:hypothetical protein